MATTSYKIDSYAARIYANDLRGSLTRWAAAELTLYSGGKTVGLAYFARNGENAPDCVLSGEVIYFHAQGEQYERILDLLRNESPVYLAWVPKADSTEANDGDAYFYTGSEAVGEGES